MQSVTVNVAVLVGRGRSVSASPLKEVADCPSVSFGGTVLIVPAAAALAGGAPAGGATDVTSFPVRV
ncbi:hypothetical protein ColKHC_14237 [Colletotrichum higginsianum]|nr:hypothetical protein ColKHC_14237 [Colletotrichum higginsianum]